MRRVWLRGGVNIQKRSLLHAAGFNLGLLMRSPIGFGTPRGWADVWLVAIWTERQPTAVCLGLLPCLENQSCLILPLALIMAATAPKPVFTAGCRTVAAVPSDAKPEMIPAGSSFSFRRTIRAS